MPNLIRNKAEVYDAPLVDIAFTYAKMTGRHLRVGTSRRAAEVATHLAMMANEDEDGRTGIPKGTKPSALTLEELAEKKRQRSGEPKGAWLANSHFRTVAELKEDFNMAKKTKAAAAATAAATTGEDAVKTDGNTNAETAGSEGAATESAAAAPASDKPAKPGKAPNFQPGPDLLLFFKKHPERDIREGSLRHKIMVHAALTGGKIKLSELSAAMGENVRSDVKTLMKLEHCVEVTQEQFDALSSEPVTFVGSTKPPKPAKPTKKADAAPAATGEAVTGEQAAAAQGGEQAAGASAEEAPV